VDSAPFQFPGILFFLVLTILSPGAQPHGRQFQPTQPIRIGTYDNAPKIYQQADGSIAGFYAELVEAIASSSSLAYRFVHGTWEEGLSRLAAGEIDVMVDVAYSDERARLYTFNGETVLINWGVVYTRQNLGIESFLDLKGLRVAGMRGGIHSEGESGLIALGQRFDIHFDYMPMDDYLAAFTAVHEGRADAAVVNRLFGLEYEDAWDVRRSNVVFNPIALKFAFTKDSPETEALVRLFDTALKELKANRSSAYYSALQNHLPGFVEDRQVIPGWMKVSLPLVSTGHLVALFSVVLLAREIRRRKQLEVSMLEAKSAAEAANRTKTTFLANMSHEIRTPMNAILGYAQILDADPSLKEEQRAHLGKIAAGGRHLLSIINEILDMSKIEAGRTALEHQPFNLPSTLRDAFALVKIKADTKGLEYSLEMDPSLPGEVLGDEGKLRQILVNLLGNAVKFTDRGSVTLRVDHSGIPVKGPGSHLISFTVRDTGPGIPAGDLERIFSPFEQIQGVGTTREGTGLGLAISRRLAQMMGGDIQAQSSPQGSTFIFTASLVVGDRRMAGSRRPERCGGPVVGLRQKCTALIVDDHDSNRDILMKMLKPYGFDILQASDGMQACTIFEELHPQLVLLDLVMPVMDGFEALGHMRTWETKKGSRRSTILAVTASILEEQRAAVMAAGADDFIRKPFMLQDLLEVIAQFIDFERSTTDENCMEPTTGTTPTDNKADPAKLHAEAEGLSEEWMTKLRHALVTGDLDSLSALAGSLPPDHGVLRDTIQSAVSSFDFSLLEEVFLA
jgi:signal transduction histidine kinase/DNA-binding response OmpR family regulator